MNANNREPPANIGPYRILTPLGKGGMGMVYRAQHRDTGQHVALKTVHMAQSKFLHQIRREIHTLSQLRHPGIVTIIEHGVEEGNPWYAMELIRGVTLGEYCWGTQPSPTADPLPQTSSGEQDVDNTGFEFSGLGDTHIKRAVATVEKKLQVTHADAPWWTETLADPWSGAERTQQTRSPSPEVFHTATGTPPVGAHQIHQTTRNRTVPAITPEHLLKALEIVWRICLPLSYLHGEGIIHCDLKPSNVLVRDDGWPVLIDFGLLTQFTSQVSRETLDTLPLGLGTLPYMAPEQLNGALLDARSDLYAVGCILYELLTGKPPFTGAPGVVVAQHLTEQPVPPSYHTQGIPPALDQLVLRLLAKQPQDRLGYADTIRYTLRTLLTSMHAPAPREWPGLPRQTPRVYLYRPSLAGRHDSLTMLEEKVHSLCDGVGDLVLLQGESGVGKTRLILELAGYAMSQEIRVITGKCLDHLSPPLEVFQPFFQAVADRARMQGESETHSLLGKEGWSLLPYAPALQDLPGKAEQPTLVDVPPEQVRHILSRALQYTLLTYAKDTPLLLLLDDLQWADELTQEALLYLAEHSPLCHVLIVGAYRSEETTPHLQKLAQLPQTSLMPLERLDLQAVGAIVRDMLALSETPEGFSRYLRHQSEGNPFFVAEYLRTAVEEGLLWRNPQGYWQIGSQAASMNLSPRDSQLPLPGSLRGLITRRLRDLSLDASELISAAAVMGLEVSLFLLQTMTRFTLEQLWSGLEELSRRELLVEASRDTLRFAHAKLREVMLDMLTQEQRAALHHQAALTIEHCYSQDLNPHFAGLCHHWKQAGDLVKAREYCKRAAEQARQQYVNDEAIQHYQTYLTLEEYASEESVTIRHELGDILKLVGRIKEAEQVYQQAVTLAQKMSDRRLEGESLSKLGLLHWHTGRLESGREVLETALSIHREVGNRRSEGMTTGYLAGLQYYSGDLKVARQQYQYALEIHREVGNRQAEGRDLSNLGNVFFEQNELDTALNYYTAALQLLDEPGAKRFRNLVLNNMAHVHHYQGNTDTAQDLYLQMLADARFRGDLASEGMALGNLALLYRDLGRIEEAMHSFQEALNRHRKVGNRLFEAVHRIQQLTLDRLLGQPLTTLKATLMSAETLLRNTGDTFYLSLAYCEAGHIRLANLQSAETELDKALAKAVTAGITPETPTEIGISLRLLQNAQAAFLQEQFLYCGQRIDDIPPGLRSRLETDGYLP